MVANLHGLTFKATDHPNKRTLGAHLGDVFNVKGFGATGDGVADDTAEIQGARDACYAAGGGTVYFPIGSYKTSAPITFDEDDEVPIRFLGELDGSLITGSFNGYLFDRSLASPNNTKTMRVFERLSFINSGATGGCIRIGSSVGAAIRSCKLSAHICITTEDSVGVSSANTQVQDCLITGRKNYVDANGIIIGGGGSITGTDVHGHNVAVRAYGSGLFLGGGRIERCSQALLLGVDSGDNDVGLTGFHCTGHSFEGNWTAIHFQGTVSGYSIGGVGIIGHEAGNAGPASSFDVGEPAAKRTEYGIRFGADKASNGVLAGFGFSGSCEIAAFSMPDSTARANNLIVGGNVAIDTGAGTLWDRPDKAHTARFINCTVAQTHVFADLPASPLEGEEYSITNSNTAVWGATAAGGGSDNVVVRYNGTNWTVVGK